MTPTTPRGPGYARVAALARALCPRPPRRRTARPHAQRPPRTAACACSTAPDSVCVPHIPRTLTPLYVHLPLTVSHLEPLKNSEHATLGLELLVRDKTDNTGD